MKRLVTTIGALGLLGYGGAAAYLKVNETDLIYHPAERRVALPDNRWRLPVDPVRYAAADGTGLTAWAIPADSTADRGYWMLICHGNYGNIGYGERPEFYASMRGLGVSLFAFDYRGFGASDGAPSETGLYADAEASYRYLTDSLHVPPTRILLFGHSLGSGVATELATRVPAAALIVEGGYTSVVDRGAELYPWMPVRALTRQHFASIDKVGSIPIPKLYLHSPEDDIIPFAHGERIVAAAAEPKELVPVRGGHMLAFREDSAKYFGAIRRLIDRLP